MRRHSYDLHIVLWPAEDVPGQWVAHCLELDVVSQGNSLQQAYAMAEEAVRSVLLADLQARRDPTARRAPEEEWAAMWKRLQAARPLPLSVLESNNRQLSFLMVEAELIVTEMTRDEHAAISRSVASPTPAEFRPNVAFAA